MHHRKGRDYQACNVGWLWKQQHVYTGGQTDTNFTGTRQIVKCGDSQAVGLVTDRYRFSWAVIPRSNLPNGRLITYVLGSASNRNGQDVTISTGLTIVAHSFLVAASSSRTNTFGLNRIVVNQTAQTHQGFTLNMNGSHTTFNEATEAVAVRL